MCAHLPVSWTLITPIGGGGSPLLETDSYIMRPGLETISKKEDVDLMP